MPRYLGNRRWIVAAVPFNCSGCRKLCQTGSLKTGGRAGMGGNCVKCGMRSQRSTAKGSRKFFNIYLREFSRAMRAKLLAEPMPLFAVDKPPSPD